MQAQREYPAGHSNGRLGSLQSGGVRATVFLVDSGEGRRPIEFVRIRFVPARFDLGELFLAL
jgi:hypothetical protein